jgi:hypothetical protein
MIFVFTNPNYPFLILIKEKDYPTAKLSLEEYLCRNTKYDKEGDWTLKDAMTSVSYNVWHLKP